MGYFTVEELRAAYPDLANVARFPDAKLEADRAFAEQWFEAAAKVAYVPRTRTEQHRGTGKPALFLQRAVAVSTVTAVVIDGVALTPEELAELVVLEYGVVERPSLWPLGAVVDVTYTHGFSEPDELVKQAVMMLAAEKALPSTIPARATSISTDIGSYRISQADRTGKTGIPNVDAVIGLLGDDRPAVG